MAAVHIHELWLLEEDEETGLPRWLTQLARRLTRKYGRRLKTRLAEDHSVRPEFRDDPEAFLLELAAALPDILVRQPDRARRAFTWLVEGYLKGGIRFAEDMMGTNSRAMSALAIWADKRQRHNYGLSDDIRDYPDLRALEKVTTRREQKSDAVPPSRMLQRAMSRPEVAKGTHVVHDGPDYMVVSVTNYPAARFWGSGTSWCTVPNEQECMYYLDQGPLYIVLDKRTDERFQFHPETAQFADTQDEMLYPEEIRSKFPTFPVVMGDDWWTFIEALLSRRRDNVPLHDALEALVHSPYSPTNAAVRILELAENTPKEVAEAFLTNDAAFEKFLEALPSASYKWNVLLKIAISLADHLPEEQSKKLFLEVFQLAKSDRYRNVEPVFDKIFEIPASLLPDQYVLDVSKNSLRQFWNPCIVLSKLLGVERKRPGIVRAFVDSLDSDESVAIAVCLLRDYDKNVDPKTEKLFRRVLRRVVDAPKVVLYAAADRHVDFEFVSRLFPLEVYTEALARAVEERHSALRRFLPSPHHIGETAKRALARLPGAARVKIPWLLYQESDTWAEEKNILALFDLLPPSDRMAALRYFLERAMALAPEAVRHLVDTIPHDVARAIAEPYARGAPWAGRVRNLLPDDMPELRAVDAERAGQMRFAEL